MYARKCNNSKLRYSRGENESTTLEENRFLNTEGIKMTQTGHQHAESENRFSLPKKSTKE